MKLKGINEKHKVFCKRFIETNNATKAYSEAYGIESYKICQAAGWRLLQQDVIKNYLEFLRTEVKETYKVDKTSILMNLINMRQNIEDLMTLGSLPTLTEDQRNKFDRLSKICKVSDFSKINDMINRMAGNYEPDKIDIKQEWVINFNDDDDDNDDNTDNDE
jgi:hypothetical protein